jgi:hypothetical protein
MIRSVGIYARQCGMSTCHVFVIESNDARTLGHLHGKWPCSYPFSCFSEVIPSSDSQPVSSRSRSPISPRTVSKDGTTHHQHTNMYYMFPPVRKTIHSTTKYNTKMCIFKRIFERHVMSL